MLSGFIAGCPTEAMHFREGGMIEDFMRPTIARSKKSSVAYDQEVNFHRILTNSHIILL